MKQFSNNNICIENKAMQILSESKIIPIIEPASEDQIPRLIYLYHKHGFHTLEVKMTSPWVVQIVKQLKLFCPDTYLMAGTCNSPQDIKKAVDMGLDIFVSPNFDEKMMSYACLHNLPYIPCVNTIEHLALGVSLGYSLLKFYPAEESGGTAFLEKAIKLYDDIRFIATGGLMLNRIQDYLKEQNVAACCTSHIASPRLLQQYAWAEIEKRIIVAENMLKEDY